MGQRVNKAADLRKLLATGEVLVCPGGYDGLTARLIELAGFKAVYATGAGIANSQIAFADVGLITMSEMLEQARKMIAAVDVPVICDIDTGFGNAINLHRTVAEFARAGAAAVQIEDQVIPKKCGHFEGKQVLPFDESVLKIKAAIDARGDDDLVIIARTDALAVEGFEATMQRALAYKEAGADVIFFEAPQTVEQMQEIGRRIPGPKVANIVEGGKTPLVPLNELQAMGFQIVLYANLVLRSSVKAIEANLAHLHKAGDSTAILDRLITMDERARITRKPELDALEQRFVITPAAS